MPSFSDSTEKSSFDSNRMEQLLAIRQKQLQTGESKRREQLAYWKNASSLSSPSPMPSTSTEYTNKRRRGDQHHYQNGTKKFIVWYPKKNEEMYKNAAQLNHDFDPSSSTTHPLETREAARKRRQQNESYTFSHDKGASSIKDPSGDSVDCNNDKDDREKQISSPFIRNSNTTNTTIARDSILELSRYYSAHCIVNDKIQAHVGVGAPPGVDRVSISAEEREEVPFHQNNESLPSSPSDSREQMLSAPDGNTPLAMDDNHVNDNDNVNGNGNDNESYSSSNSIKESQEELPLSLGTDTNKNDETNKNDRKRCFNVFRLWVLAYNHYCRPGANVKTKSNGIVDCDVPKDDICHVTETAQKVSPNNMKGCRESPKPTVLQIDKTLIYSNTGKNTISSMQWENKEDSTSSSSKFVDAREKDDEQSFSSGTEISSHPTNIYLLQLAHLTGNSHNMQVAKRKQHSLSNSIIENEHEARKADCTWDPTPLQHSSSEIEKCEDISLVCDHSSNVWFNAGFADGSTTSSLSSVVFTPIRKSRKENFAICSGVVDCKARRTKNSTTKRYSFWVMTTKIFFIYLFVVCLNCIYCKNPSNILATSAMKDAYGFSASMWLFRACKFLEEMGQSVVHVVPCSSVEEHGVRSFYHCTHEFAIGGIKKRFLATNPNLIYLSRDWNMTTCVGVEVLGKLYDILYRDLVYSFQILQAVKDGIVWLTVWFQAQSRTVMWGILIARRMIVHI